MRFRAAITITIMIILSLSITMAEGVMSNAILNGEYLIGEYSPYQSGGRTVTRLVESTFKGDGTGSYKVIASSDSATDSGDFTYSISPDGALNIEDDKGIVCCNGDILFFADTDNKDESITVMFGVKKSSGMDDSALDGNYMLGQFMDNAVLSGGNTVTCLIELGFQEGSADYREIYNSTGSTSHGTLSYSLSSDGTFTVEGNEKGIVSPDGNVLFIINTDPSDDSVFLMIGIKKSADIDSSIFTGRYLFGEIAYDSNFIIQELDVIPGDGSISYSVIDSSDDAGDISGDFNYSLGKDGTLTTDYETGMVSPDGSVVFMIDTDPSDDSLALAFGIKSSPVPADSKNNGSCFIISISF